MKKILIAIISFFVFGLFIASCENPTKPDDKAGANKITLSKAEKKDVYHYELIAVDPNSDSYGRISLKMVENGKYSFIINAYNLEPGTQYELGAGEPIPMPEVCDHVFSEENTDTANFKGTLIIHGEMNLKSGYTLYIFTIVKGCVSKILQIETLLF
jgi:hypothetical protein